MNSENPLWGASRIHGELLERFELIRGKDDLTTYTFNTGVAKHTFCKHCGIHPFYVPRSEPDKIDVNARCIDDIDLTVLKAKDFDGKHWGGLDAAAHASMTSLTIQPSPLERNVRFWPIADIDSCTAVLSDRLSVTAAA